MKDTYWQARAAAWFISKTNFYRFTVVLFSCGFFFQALIAPCAEKMVVTAIEPQLSTIDWTERATGELLAVRRTSLQMRNKGTLEKLTASEGERVKKDQLLARLELITFELGVDASDKQLTSSKAAANAAGSALDVARINVKQAEVRLETATKEFERAKNLKSKESITPQSFDLAEGNFKMAQVGLEAAKKQVMQAVSAEALARAQADSAQVGLKTAQQRLAESSLFAPFDGLIVSRPIQEHELLGDKAVLYQLVDDSELELIVKMPERFLPLVQIGTPLEFKSDLNDQTFSASVSQVIPSVDPLNRTFVLKSFISNTDGKLRHGSYVDVNVILQHKENALLLPIGAVRLSSDNKAQGTVFLIENNQAKAVEVKLGLTKAGHIEIVAGLKPGSKVVLMGADKVSDAVELEVTTLEKK